MFTNTIDKKNTYTNNDGIELVDLSDSIFNSNLKAVTCSFYKVTKEMLTLAMNQLKEREGGR